MRCGSETKATHSAKNVSAVLKALFLTFFLMTCPGPVSGAKAAALCGDPLSSRILALFQDADQRVSLGAMLISDYVLHDDCLVNYVLQSRKPNEDLLARNVKNFYLALARPLDVPDDGYTRAFLDAFPEDPKEFNAVLAFDASLTRTVSGRMVMEIVSMSECHRPVAIRKAAREKILRLMETQERSGWAAEIFPDAFTPCENK